MRLLSRGNRSLLEREITNLLTKYILKEEAEKETVVVLMDKVEGDGV
jgi:hypothetical protein